MSSLSEEVYSQRPRQQALQDTPCAKEAVRLSGKRTLTM
ncbi:unnamed protein product [Staurois parvus]|uniref:Uncharacterized protein n=1 Tax=Staurois parvus TaxID=386267 RepID=A0ABN9A9W3_9NEOB|nr:unnamed protein product [Staurois parvus]